tara:strand:+ start:1254 stop:1703 length:450 start_codon:yes stop_codon:yes gene_type:complete
MAIKESKVTSAKFITEKELKFGTFYEHEVEFDNGDTGFYLSKTKDQAKFVVGETVTFEHTPHDKWPKVKPVDPNFVNSLHIDKASSNVSYQNTSKDELICRQNALTSAVRSLGEGCTAQEYIARAELFKQYTFEGKTETKVEKTTDLPF